MNSQLQSTIQALSGGLTTVDADTAVSNVSSWHSALSGAAGAENVVAGLAELKAALESGNLEEAANLLPNLGSEVEAIVSAAPAEDQAGLRQLAGILKG
ncbi:hypothetical protein [Deinococcus sp. Leaf326]|jgi:hypothetical protein|uniref:hypothetical protein n=1 Tax=Deinococcus sp. Leaf326 TaxID=1736338 RepID=UPI000700771E|nr:hypothetical protein [Deinococcus sp. Leaf326]KQR27786.1 hypothetical protein ASF71_04040 [Deinococcus sp. Leaf326]